MLGGLLGGKFSNKCKHGVKCIYSRLVIIRKKKQAMLRYLRKDVADLLANGHDKNAFGRIEALIVEMNLASCYDMIEQYCQCILQQLPSLQKQRECSEEVMEAMSTLIHAAARFSDLPELCDLRSLFTERYGSQMESSINREFVEKVEKKSFSVDKKLRVMQGIAQEFSVIWDSKSFQQRISGHPGEPASNQPKRQIENKDHLSRAENNWRNAAVKGRKEAITNAGGDLKAVPSNERWEGPPRSLVQKEQVQPQPQPQPQDISCRPSPLAYDSAERRRSENLPERRSENIDHLYADKWRNATVKVRTEAVIIAGGDLEVPSKERCKPLPKTLVQKEQVQPEPRDIHVIPSIINGQRHGSTEKNRKKIHAAEGPENVEPYYSDAKVLPSVKHIGSYNRAHKDEGHYEGSAGNRSQTTQEGFSLIGLEKRTVGPVVSRDVKAANMIAPYTKSRGGRNDTDVELSVPSYGESPKVEEGVDSIAQERGHLKTPNNKASLFNRMPPYTKPSFKTPSTATATDEKVTCLPINSPCPADDDLSNDNEKLKPFSVRRKHPKPPLVGENEGANPTSRTSSSRRQEGRQIHDYNGEKMAMDQGLREPAVEEVGNAVCHDGHASRTRSGHRKHGSKQRAPIYDGDRDEEEEVMDRMLVHLSRKGTSKESSKARTRSTRAPPTDLALDADRNGDRHHYHHSGNGRFYQGPGEPAHRHPERISSLPSEPTTPVPEFGGGTGHARCSSLHQDMQSPKGGLVHPRLPDYDELAARFIALRKA